jgi:hypothetical protein
MAHYAELNETNQVIYVAYLNNETITDEFGTEMEQLGIDHLRTCNGENRRWIRTSYRGNFRNKYACLGDTYREDLDMFISPQPYESWSLNEVEGKWHPPIPKPNLTDLQLESGDYYLWDETLYQSDNTQGWILKTL